MRMRIYVHEGLLVLLKRTSPHDARWKQALKLEFHGKLYSAKYFPRLAPKNSDASTTAKVIYSVAQEREIEGMLC